MSNQLKKPERGGEGLKKLEVSEGKKKQAIWFQSWPISLGGTNCSIEISLVKKDSASRFHHSKKFLRREDGISFMSTRLLDS